MRGDFVCSLNNGVNGAMTNYLESDNKNYFAGKHLEAKMNNEVL